MNEIVHLLKQALEKILDEASNDRDWYIVIAAAQGALDDLERMLGDELPFQEEHHASRGH